SGWMRVLRDARQQDLMLADGFVAPTHGSHVVLTIDETIQSIAERALEKAMIKHHADAATIIVMDIRTGEILALANRPTYNLDAVAESSLESRTNRAISFVYEPGSVFKIVTAAAALEEEAFTEGDIIYCEQGEYRVGNHILHDHRPHGKLTFKEVFGLSSNIGVTKIAQEIGADAVYKYAKRFRFGIKTNIDLQGEVRGVIRKPSMWSKTSIGAIPIGHEVLVTPLQLVSALSAIANGGVFMQPYVVREIRSADGVLLQEVTPKIIDRVISEDTARRVTEILVGVVENGTAKRARIRGVRVAGKTGTAQKVINGTYSHSQFYASFMGFAPADNPRLAAVVIYDEPHPDHYGGTVAAPVFKEVIENSLRYFESDE
ncbi:peptidoglycan D,D-transpeptidase FtsI family protein, partial [Candidatus Omnitrophota bacterium]